MPDLSDSNSPSAHISELVFSDGRAIPLDKRDVVLVVGPNNAGKSATLRGIRDKLKDPSSRNPVLQSLQVHKTGTLEIFKGWISEWAQPEGDGASLGNTTWNALGHGVHLKSLS
jgi:hypothetical protein